MTDRRRQHTPEPVSTSRALSVLNDASSSRRHKLSANPNRRTSAFLAHLALQYDGLSARRTLRSERLESAITGYGAEQRMGSLPRARSTHDLKV
jgi:hypothetical protein